jgi:hypothetical protein
LEHVLRWWARWLPTAQDPGEVAERESRVAPAPEADPLDAEPSAEPLTIRATRVD